MHDPSSKLSSKGTTYKRKQRGDLFWYDFSTPAPGKRGDYAMKDPHPALIVENDDLIPKRRTLLISPLTKAGNIPKLQRYHVLVDKNDTYPSPLPLQSVSS